MVKMVKSRGKKNYSKSIQKWLAPSTHPTCFITTSLSLLMVKANTSHFEVVLQYSPLSISILWEKVGDLLMIYPRTALTLSAVPSQMQHELLGGRTFLPAPSRSSLITVNFFSDFLKLYHELGKDNFFSSVSLIKPNKTCKWSIENSLPYIKVYSSLVSFDLGVSKMQFSLRGH